MQKITFEDTQVTKKPYVTINERNDIKWHI